MFYSTCRCNFIYTIKQSRKVALHNLVNLALPTAGSILVANRTIKSLIFLTLLQKTVWRHSEAILLDRQYIACVV